jgi:chromodomain-helicase-DNA-binding protein 7
MTEKQLLESVKAPKNKLNRFNKAFYKRLAEGKFDEEAVEEQKYFDPAYCEVDRILTTTELFPVIHQKKVHPS